MPTGSGDYLKIATKMERLYTSCSALAIDTKRMTETYPQAAL